MPNMARVDGLDAPPFAIRAQVLTPLAAGGTSFLRDGVLSVDAAGRITAVSDWSANDTNHAGAIDLRPLVLMPGLVDLHAHLPQLPNAGLGAG
ncbi:MAG: hypothetical protein ABI797_07595, partial [Chloroflexota bacterium]